LSVFAHILSLVHIDWLSLDAAIANAPFSNANHQSTFVHLLTGHNAKSDNSVSSQEY
jgi:hypothetical protein